MYNSIEVGLGMNYFKYLSVVIKYISFILHTLNY